MNLGRIAGIISLFAAMGCDRQMPSAGPTSQPSPSMIQTPPAGRITFLQSLVDVDGEANLAGTGWFARTPGGATVALTARHLVQPDGRPLAEVSWFEIEGEDSWKATRCFARPLPLPPLKSNARDLSHDFLALIPEPVPAGVTVLSLSDARPRGESRENANDGEPVWMPAGFHSAKASYVWILATVVAATDRYVLIRVADDRRLLGGSSGSPVISRESGLVIGLMAEAAKDTDGTLYAFLTPARGVLAALRQAEAVDDHPPTREVLGDPKRPPKPRSPADDDD